jgi:glycosyltransferase involved in cell wall biosynthesis
MPSLYEGFGLVTAEAMAAGVPVIASNVDGLSELIENQVTGILVQPGNASELSKQIIKHIDNKQLGKQYSILAKIRVTEKFNKESFQKSCTLLYQTLLINAKK